MLFSHTAAVTFEISISYRDTTRPHNPEYIDLKYLCEFVKQLLSVLWIPIPKLLLCNRADLMVNYC